MILMHVFFRFLNFFVLISVFYYAIVYMFIPAMLVMIKKYNLFIQSLQDRKQAIKNDAQLIVQKIEEQKIKFTQLESKFVLWQKVCHQKRDSEFLELVRNKESIAKRLQVRSDVVTHELAIKEQLPYILSQVTETLRDKYQDVSLQKDYIKQLIDRMKENL